MEEFIEKITKYVKENDEIDACLLLGSVVDRKTKRDDEFSDVDLLIITEHLDYYLHNCEWLNFYKKVDLYFNDPISFGIGTELRVCFENELLSDIAIVNLQEFMKLMKNEIFCTKIIGRGYRILKSNFANQLYEYNELNFISIPKFNSESLNRLIDEFWIDIYNILKYYYRNDYFTALYAFERRITKIIIAVLEESYKISGKDDVLFNGRYMERWLNDDDYNSVNSIFLNLNPSTFLDCLKKAIELFENKCKFISDNMGFYIEDKTEISNKVKCKVKNGARNI